MSGAKGPGKQPSWYNHVAMQDRLRRLPSVDKLLTHPRVVALVDGFGRSAVIDAVRRRLEQARAAVRAGEPLPPVESHPEAVASMLDAEFHPHLQRVINATGVIIHTNLGRAPLSTEAIAAVQRTAVGYSNLEYELEPGERGHRHVHVERLLTKITGAEAGMAVNNNASAVMLGLATVATGKEVIVSRGEAIEIGGGFRIPEVLKQSGATLVEVGTTNRTYAHDYEAAITERTGALLHVHTSNFRVVGFTQAPSLADLVALGRKRGVPVLHDVGSGCLLDTPAYGMAHEPTPQESVAAGADLVFFSGDKLLGGPQAGIIVGKKQWVDKLKRHPLARAVRIDKLTLAALEATLLHYLKEEATTRIPVWRMIAMPPAEIERRARRWAEAMGEPAIVIQGWSTVGGGSLPGETLPTHLLAIPANESGDDSAAGVARRLRLGSPPAVVRIEEHQIILDPRTVLPEEDATLLSALRGALQQR